MGDVSHPCSEEVDCEKEHEEETGKTKSIIAAGFFPGIDFNFLSFFAAEISAAKVTYENYDPLRSPTFSFSANTLYDRAHYFYALSI